MKLHLLPAGPIQTNAYLLIEPSRQEAVLIDAPAGVWPQVEERLAPARCRLAAIWLTHGHWDHIQGVNEVASATAAPVSGHRADQLLFERSREVLKGRVAPSLLPPGLDEMEPIRIDHWFEQGERGEALGLEFEVRHVPGHCPGNVLFYFAALQAAFVGDALFRGSIGRTDLPGGDFFQLARSIRERIYTLPAETQIHPGHGLATTVGEEMKHNPYVPAG